MAPSESLSKFSNSIPGCRRPDIFGDSPQNLTGPNRVVTALKIASSSPSVETDVSGSDSMLMDDLIWHKSSFAEGGQLLDISISMSLVAKKEEGGLEEFRLGVNSGMDEEDDIDGGTEDERLWVEGGEGSVSVRVVSFDVMRGMEGAPLLSTTLLNAAVAGKGGNMTSVANPWGCCTQL